MSSYYSAQNSRSNCPLLYFLMLCLLLSSNSSVNVTKNDNLVLSRSYRVLWSSMQNLILSSGFAGRVETYIQMRVVSCLFGYGRHMKMILSERMVGRFLNLTVIMFLTINSMPERDLFCLGLLK